MGPPTTGMMEGLLVSNSPFLGDFLDPPLAHSNNQSARCGDTAGVISRHGDRWDVQLSIDPVRAMDGHMLGSWAGDVRCWPCG